MQTLITNETTNNKLVTFENKILQRIFGSRKQGYTWRTNCELRALCIAPDILAEAKIKKFRRTGHVNKNKEDMKIKRI